MNKQDWPRVLVVDDDLDAVESLSDLLDGEGFDPVTAFTGEECLEKLNDNEISAVLLDLKMPGIGGVATLQIIRQEFPATKVIITTGHASPQDISEIKRLGVLELLLKPIDPVYLVKVLRGTKSVRTAG